MSILLRVIRELNEHGGKIRRITIKKEAVDSCVPETTRLRRQHQLECAHRHVLPKDAVKIAQEVVIPMARLTVIRI
jgi:hypothetical protein